MRRGLFGRLGKLGLNLMIQPNISPIIFLTQWKIVGNSQVHTDPYLTSWKVSGNSQVQQYLTQWKVEGNSQVHTLPYPDGVVLPTGYKRCKYLEAHGTEYIELPIGFDNTDEMEMTVSFMQINLSDKYAIAPKTWNDNNNRFAMGMHLVNTQGFDSEYLFCAGYGSARTSDTVYTPYVSQDTNVHLFTYANYLFKLDNSSTKDVSSITFGGTTADLRLFYGYNSPTKCRIYSYHQVKEDETEFNLIPCLDDNDVPCFYDIVSQTAFYNQGTGSFTYELYPQPTEIWSCGDYSSIDNKYHVKISDGSNVYDIALTEPLRKVNDVADTIEFPSETEGKALVTRPLGSYDLGILNYAASDDGQGHVRHTTSITNIPNCKAPGSSSTLANILCAIYETKLPYPISTGTEGIGLSSTTLSIHDDNYNATDSETKAAFKAHLNNVELIYELATPTTELIDVSPFPVSSTDTYTSANETPYSAFTYANPLIYSCGDLGQDGKYHVKISNGVTIFDIPLDAPLRKVNDVADTIEFPSGTDGKALVTRNLGSIDAGYYAGSMIALSDQVRYRYLINVAGRKSGSSNIVLIPGYTISKNPYIGQDKGIACGTGVSISFYNDDYCQSNSAAAFRESLRGNELIYELATPTTELIDVSPFPVSSTDTYTSANETPYSAFEYKKNVEIWSCGEYSEIDNKYHIVVLPQGKSPTDIALDAPLRKVNDIADTIEFPSSVEGKALVTRYLHSIDLGNYTWSSQRVKEGKTRMYTAAINLYQQYAAKPTPDNNTAPNFLVSSRYAVVSVGIILGQSTIDYNCISISNTSTLTVFDVDYNPPSSETDFKNSVKGIKLVYELNTPTTELVDAPQIEEADSYSCVISQGGKAVSWSSFETD